MSPMSIKHVTCKETTQQCTTLVHPIPPWHGNSCEFIFLLFSLKSSLHTPFDVSTHAFNVIFIMPILWELKKVLVSTKE